MWERQIACKINIKKKLTDIEVSGIRDSIPITQVLIGVVGLH